MTKLQYKRLLVKFSGEAVAGDDVHGIDPKILDHMANSVKGVQELGAEIGIVIGGGNLFRGEKLSKAGMDRVAGDHMGMLATVMNGIALRDALERAGVKTRVMSAISMSGLVEHYDRRLAIQLLSDGYVVIFTAGTGNPFFTTDTAGCLRAIETQSNLMLKATRVMSAISMSGLVEHYDRRLAIQLLSDGYVVIFTAGTGNPFFTTDTAGCLRAIETQSSLMLKATRVDGVYSADPETNKDAVFYNSLSFDEAIQQNLKIMDATALTLARDHSLPIKVFDFSKENALLDIACGKSIGTLISS